MSTQDQSEIATGVVTESSVEEMSAETSSHETEEKVTSVPAQDESQDDLGVSSSAQAIDETMDKVVKVKDDEEEKEEAVEEEDQENEEDFGDFDDFDDFDDFQEETEPTIETPALSTPAAGQEPPVNSMNCLSETDFSNSANLQASIASILSATIKLPSSTTTSFASNFPYSQSNNNTRSNLETTDSDSIDNSSINDDDELDLGASVNANNYGLPRIVTTHSHQLSRSSLNTIMTPVEEPITNSSPSYFNERSQSLWHQLALVPPQATATDWKRSAIRRLFMVSLGVPLDLDEILPQKNAKRLVLPAVASRRRSRSRSRTRKEGGDASATSTTSPDATTTNKSQSNTKNAISQIEQDTDQNLLTWNFLAQVSELAQLGMTTDELETHITDLQKAIEQANSTLTFWETKKTAALKDKEDFEGLIESLVEYAQRVGKGGNSSKKKK